MAAHVDTDHGVGTKKSTKEKVKGAFEGLLGGKKHTGARGEAESADFRYDTIGADVKSDGTAHESTMPIDHGGNVQMGCARCDVCNDTTGPHAVGPKPRGTESQESQVKQTQENNGKLMQHPQADNSYEAWINEDRSEFQDRIGSTPQVRSKPGSDRSITQDAEKPNLGAQIPVYGEATNESPSENRGFMDKVKDTITGQKPNRGIATGTATSGDQTTADSTPVQDAGVGRKVPT